MLNFVPQIDDIESRDCTSGNSDESSKGLGEMSMDSTAGPVGWAPRKSITGGTRVRTPSPPKGTKRTAMCPLEFEAEEFLTSEAKRRRSLGIPSDLEDDEELGSLRDEVCSLRASVRAKEERLQLLYEKQSLTARLTAIQSQYHSISTSSPTVNHMTQPPGLYLPSRNYQQYQIGLGQSRSVGSVSGTSQPVGFSRRDHHRWEAHIDSQAQSFRRRVARRGSKDKRPQVLCWNCEKFGHYKRNCRAPARLSSAEVQVSQSSHTVTCVAEWHSGKRQSTITAPHVEIVMHT